MKKHFFRTILSFCVTALLVGNPLVAFCAYEKGDEYIDGIDELTPSELSDIEDEAYDAVDESAIRDEIDEDGLYSQIDEDELRDEIDMEELESQIDEDELLSQIDDEDLEAELEQREAEEAEKDGSDVKTAKVEIDPHPVDVTNISYPTWGKDSPFDYVIDPMQLIYATNAAKYGGGNVEEDANLLFRNKEGDYDFSSRSDMLSVKNMGNVPAKFELIAEIEDAEDVIFTDSDEFDGNDCSLYLALVDAEGNETPIGNDLEEKIEIELGPAPDNAYAYTWNEETQTFDYGLTTDPENIDFDSYSFGLVGKCNGNGNWSKLRKCPTIKISWSAVSVLTDWDAVNAKKAQEEAERKSLHDAKIDALRDEKLRELKDAALEELVEEKLSELIEEKKDELLEDEFERLFKEEYLGIREEKIRTYISDKREREAEDDDVYYDASDDGTGYDGGGSDNSGYADDSYSGDESTGVDNTSEGGSTSGSDSDPQDGDAGAVDGSSDSGSDSGEDASYAEESGAEASTLDSYYESASESADETIDETAGEAADADCEEVFD
ncbi:hypothetical protein [Butyrivibrio sp. WCD3002]|uniref:hypothetical protein n=1 Tax=Butyrivibrio sp. WCD3002 TaxID=1280676 RepID=UPI0004241557|nr:hypothetical protein [Butyrivibrio sp. WCD3002]